MKGLLICPEHNPAVPFLSARLPLAVLPMAGQGLVEYWLSDLAQNGVKEVIVLASDRAEQISKAVGNGARWGIKAQVLQEAREVTPAEALIKYAPQLQCVPPNRCIAVMDHFPGCSQQPLFVSYEAWFRGLLSWLPKAQTLERVGVRQIRPGVYVSVRSRISASAELHSPSWIGANAIVSPGAIIGPHAVVEAGAFIDTEAEIRSSYLGAGTYVGRGTEVRDSLAWGKTVLEWQTGVIVEIKDRFILGPLDRGTQDGGWLERLRNLYSRPGKAGEEQVRATDDGAIPG